MRRQDPNVECWKNEEEDSGDPPRLWAHNAMFPGTAFTRSIGDACELPNPSALCIQVQFLYRGDRVLGNLLLRRQSARWGPKLRVA